MKKTRVVLAFSGGLDTTFCAIHLSRVCDYEVHAVTVNTGGFSVDDIAALETKARALGVASFTCVDETATYYHDVIRFLIYGNVLKNGTYPLSVSAERFSQARAIAAHALSIGADAIAHGSTGAGNDQVRFDMVFRTLVPQMEIITPIRDLRLSREEEIAFLTSHGVEVNAAKAQYSINTGIWGTSIGGRETLTSHLPLPDEAWPTPITATGEETITLAFTRGELTSINGESFPSPVEVIRRLSVIATPFGIGRDMHIGDTIIGIKGRVGFEAAAPIVIIKAHHALEKHVLTKWQLFWKDQLAAWYGNWLHEGQHLDPVMRDIEAFFEATQRTVTGEVFVTLSRQRFNIDGIASPHDLMSPEFGSYGEENRSWSGDDVKGFAKIFGNQAAIWHHINGGKQDG